MWTIKAIKRFFWAQYVLEIDLKQLWWREWKWQKQRPNSRWQGFRSECEVAQSCPTLCNPMDCSLPGSSTQGIFQARVLEWVAISFSKGSSQPRDRIQVSRTAGKRFTVWATREATWVLEGSCQLVENHLGYYQEAWKCTWTWGWEGHHLLGSRIYL